MTLGFNFLGYYVASFNFSAFPKYAIIAYATFYF